MDVASTHAESDFDLFFGASNEQGRAPKGGGPFVDTIQRTDAATELQYALEVMEEYSHLGLDDELAKKLHDILLKRIEEAEEDASLDPSQPIRFQVPEGIAD